jgi:hypothetical protein
MTQNEDGIDSFSKPSMRFAMWRFWSAITHRVDQATTPSTSWQVPFDVQDVLWAEALCQGGFTTRRTPHSQAKGAACIAS